MRTAESYIGCVNRFFGWSGKRIGNISKKDVRGYLEYLSEKGLTKLHQERKSIKLKE